ncbi:MAG: ABC transporter substrate-binding protein [Dehalococcoidia bacterium]|nr:ABC transporter substrate-binding protein [Dehalococcoidia bacterium]MSQ34489.1 ABC transporter substrate-binding protein [Dehalococcoidia bacterium]
MSVRTSLVRTALFPIVMAAAAMAASCSADTAATPAKPSAASTAIAGAAPTRSALPSTPAPTPTQAQVPPTPAPKRGGTLKIAQSADPTSCDLHSSRASGYVSVHTCNPLLSQIVRNPGRDHALIEPDLAVSWSSSGDGVSWEFKLRPGAQWHDGSTVTAGDLKFSLDRIIAPPASVQIGRAAAFARYVTKTESVEAIDAVTLRIRTDYPAAAFMATLASVYVSIYPKAAVEKLNPPSPVAFMSVIGSGPFKATAAVRGSSYKLTRFDAYYEPALPYLDEVQFLIMPEPAVRMAALKSHSIDTIAIVTDPEAETLSRDLAGKVSIFASPSAGGSTVQMNVARAPFDNPAVRRAVNLAISRADASLALGEGLSGAVMMPGGAWALSTQEVAKLPGSGDGAANRAEAKKLLAQAGFENGFDVKMQVRADPFAQTLADFAAGQLRQVGIRAEVVPTEPGAYQTLVVKHDFAMLAHSHSFAMDEPDAVLFDNYSCTGFENYPGLCDPGIEEMLQKQSRELDRSKRKALVDELQRRIWDADAKVWFQWTIRRTPVWSNVHGMEPGGPSLYQGRRLERVYLEP